MNGIIQEMLTLLKCEADRYSIDMRSELAAELPQIVADRVQLQQVHEPHAQRHRSHEGQRGGVKTKVPFNFAVSGKTFPAGEYTMIAASHQVRIEDAEGRLVAMVLANDISGRSAGINGQIIFHCYNDRCFLSELWSPAQDNGRQLLTSRIEANLAKEERGKYFAVLGEKPRQ